MLAGDFARKLKKLNKHLKIQANSNPDFPAALYYEHNGTLVHICGVDTNYLPEYTTWQGPKIAKGGWRRVLKILVNKDIVDRHQVYRVFGVDLSYGQRPQTYRWVDPIKKALEEAQYFGRMEAQSRSKYELANKENGKQINYMKLDDLLQIARMRRQIKGETK